MNAKKQLVAMAVKFKGNWENIYRALTKKEYLEDEEADQFCDLVKCKTITMLDSAYPAYLKHYYHPPFVLFYYGDISLIADQNKNVAIVGTREPSDLAIKTTREIAAKLARDYTIVSGLAKGIDRIGHEMAVFTGGKTIGVLGCGIDVCYPTDNLDLYKIIKKHHLLISEYCNDVTPDAYHFPQRNRLIAMFSRATFIPEANLNSGTSITANYSLNFSHPIYCLPSTNFNESLCNCLIHDGALLVRNADDILYELQK